MATHSDPGLLMRNAGLGVSIQDLHGMQGAIMDAVDAALAGMLVRAGPVCPSSNMGTMDTMWEVMDDDLNAVVAVRARGAGSVPAHALLVTADGQAVPFDPVPDDEVVVPFSDSADEIPNDGAWYSVVVRATTTTTGRGALSVTSGSPNVAGDGTRFTRMAATADFPTGTLSHVTRIVVDGTTSNDGTYSVSTITDDDTLVVSSNFLATEVIPPANWSIRGRWLSVAMEPADVTVLQRRDVEFEVLPRVAVPAAGDHVLADVYNDGGTLRIIDRRAGSCALFAQQFSARPMGRKLSANVVYDTSGATLGAITREIITPAATPQADVVSCAPVRGGQVLSVWVENGSSDLNATLSDQLPFSLAAAVYIDTGVDSASIVALPEGHADTHQVYYVKSNALHLANTDDNGATWSLQGVIWDPTGAHVSNTLRDPWAIRLQNGRMVVAVSYLSNGVTKRTIRYAYSDEYGANWDTNADAGYQAVADVAHHLDRPGLAQDVTGRILLAYESDASPRGIETRINANPSGSAWGTLTIGPAIRSSATDARYRAVPLAGETPGFVVLFLRSDTTLLSAGGRTLAYAVINGEPQTAMLADVFTSDGWLAGGSDTEPALPLGACYAQGGEIHVMHAAEQAGYLLSCTRVIETLTPCMTIAG